MTRWQSPHHQWAGSYRKALHWQKAPLWAPPMWNALETWTSSFSSRKTLFPAAGVCSWYDEHQWMDSINIQQTVFGFKVVAGNTSLVQGWSFSEELFWPGHETQNATLKIICKTTVWRFVQQWQLCKSALILLSHTAAEDNTSYILTPFRPNEFGVFLKFKTRFRLKVRVCSPFL